MTSAMPAAKALVTSLLRRRVTALFEQLPHAVAGNEEAIHELRIAGRRLRTALPVLALRPGGKRQARCREALRTLTRAAGVARDLDVAAGLLEAYLASDMSQGPKPALLRRHMRDARRRSRARLAQTLLDADIRRLRTDLGVLLARGGAETPMALARCALCARAWQARVSARLAALRATLDVEALHALRRAARRLRYLVELHGELRGRGSQAPRLLKGLQDALGHIHDQHVLATWLQGHTRRALARGARGQARQSAQLRMRAEQAIGRLHRSYLNCRPVATVSRAMEMSAIPPAPAPAVKERRRG